MKSDFSMTQAFINNGECPNCSALLKSLQQTSDTFIVWYGWCDYCGSKSSYRMDKGSEPVRKIKFNNLPRIEADSFEIHSMTVTKGSSRTFKRRKAQWKESPLKRFELWK